MPLTTGTRLASYEVIDLLGAGGMGEVYRARDSKLGRAVAIKIIRETLTFDADRVPRFEREAKVLASLNHPHIAALYGMEEADGRHFLVMELVEGETLADRLHRGAMSPEETLKIALQIADALEAAHERGVIHRDLKPANVKITPDEQVKVLDFGLAKAMETETAKGNLPDSPTLSAMATQAGIILGTAAYMSPEQAKGFPADHRSDVFSFGTVLYEMLTGRQPFQGDTAPDILASVLVRDPELTRLPADLNPRFSDLIRRCLEKHPKKRWQAIGDLRAEIEAITPAPRAVTGVVQAQAPRRPLWQRVVPIALSWIVIAALAGSAAWFFKPTPAGAVTRFAVILPANQVFSGPGRHIATLSPDGTQMAYGADGRIYLRSMAGLDLTPIRGTETYGNVTEPVFSPDGSALVFYSATDQTLKKVPVVGGAAVTVCPADNPWGMNWGPDGILFAQGNKGILRVSSNGGTPEVLVSIKGDEFAHGPQMLPGGESVLFTLANGTAVDRWDRARIVAQSLKSGERKTVIDGGSDARYLPTGHLVYALGGSLFAAAFDPERLVLKSGPAPIVEGVRRAAGGATGAANYSVSRTGSLIYIPGPVTTSSGQNEVVLADRKGSTESLKIPPGPYLLPRASPNGGSIAFGSDDGKEANVWIYDLSGASAVRRLTFGGNNRFPAWSWDSKRVAFQSDREGDLGIFWQAADGTGSVERLTKANQGESHAPESWSPKGETMLFSVTKGTDVSLWTFSLKDRKAAPFGDVHSSNPTGGVFSPDGRWVAYNATEGSKTTVYVQPFPATGNKYQVYAKPTDGPHEVAWSPDGKELFYNPRAGGFEVVSVTTQPTFAFGNPAPVPRIFQLGPPNARRGYDVVNPSGKFVGVVAAGLGSSGTPIAPQIQVVLNWFEELKQRVPVQK